MVTAAQLQAIEASIFRKLIKHLDDNKDEVQNIDMMITSKFCRNCLSKWYVSAAKEQGVEFSLEKAQEKIYGMPYADYKEKHQVKATPEQLASFKKIHP